MVRPKSFNLKWSKEAVANEALKYRSRKSFSKGSGGAYSAALKKGWIDEVCSHMKQLLKASSLLDEGEMFKGSTEV